jgi:hypothetical protein
MCVNCVMAIYHITVLAGQKFGSVLHFCIAGTSLYFKPVCRVSELTTCLSNEQITKARSVHRSCKINKHLFFSPILYISRETCLENIFLCLCIYRTASCHKLTDLTLGIFNKHGRLKHVAEEKNGCQFCTICVHGWLFMICSVYDAVFLH